MNNSIQNSEVLIGDYIKTLRKKHKIKKSEYLSSGSIPVVDQGQDFIAGYIDDAERSYDGKLPVIVFGDHTCTLKYVDFPFAVGADGTQLIRPTEDFDIRYLYYALRDLSLEHFGYQRHFKYLKTSKILCPPMPIQSKIAAILSAYDDLIENNTRRIKILEDMAQTLYQEWFVHFRFPGHENVPMVESPLGPIPQGWKVGELGDLAESIRRNVKPRDVKQETPYFGLEHLPRKSIALSNWDSVASINSAKLRFKKGEILFGKIRPYFHKVGVAPLNGICSSDTIVIHPKINEYFAITLSYVSSEHFIKYATTTSQGSKMPRADWKVLVKYPVIVPPDQITQRFNTFTCEVIDKIHNLIFQNANLRQTRDLLLPKLISGEIDVSEIDIDTNGMQPTKGGTYIPYPLTARLHSDRKILGGKPVIKGTRLAVAFILDLLKQGWSEDDIVENYPSVVHEDIEACHAYQEKVTRASVSR